MFLLLCCWILSGVMAEVPVVTHYQLKNSTLCLHVRTPPPYNGGKWTFARKTIAYDKTINPSYKEKVDYKPENLSLCIKDLNDTDTGNYTVTFSDSEFNDVSERHRVIVQELVPRPAVKISVLRSNLSAGLCSISVNCSIQDDWMWSVCDEDSCRTFQRSFSKVTITISTDNQTVVCSGSNHVSTNNVSESTRTTCFSKSDPENKEESEPPLVIIIFLAVCISLCVFSACMAKKCFSRKCDCHQGQASTHLIQSQPDEVQPHPEPRVSTSSSSPAEPAYENVDPSQPSWTHGPGEQLGAMSSQTVDTVYSVLQATNVAASLGKSDTRRQEASTSQSVISEAEHPVQIDTVYSVLQKPKNMKSQHHQEVGQDFQRR
ncbi:uncharacterized protein si:ch1073-220m6.1 [Lates calcarifer]|uniref:Uncharacterized protein si:ch1073-220m6.1 n=1 Tax=Lates calcarifer TaxID=8187 RepID=A0AAJ7PN03_LATCA|nr:uncharacterized protein si:ch1073-220m6.1 [Lates calcarifer]